MDTTIKASIYAALAASLAAPCMPALAQDASARTVTRLVLGNPTGYGFDSVVRRMAPKLGAILNTNVIVENKIGANGAIAVDAVVKAKPDGNTLAANGLSIILGVAMGEKVPYDLMKDLVPVTQLVWASAQWLAVHSSVPANNTAEFIAYLQANPGKLSYGTAGNGNITHLVTLLFLQAKGLTATHVPYKGGTFMMTDLVAGRTQFGMPSTALIVPLLKDSRVKILANAGFKRSAVLPDIPTLNESVMPGVGVASFWGIMAPAQTPAAIVKRTSDAFAKVIQDPDVKSVLVQEDFIAAGTTPEEYAALIRTELDRWSKVIRSAGLKAE
jgi:tripartite-type tricarboxylate transporter receptor subunit TctC